MPPAFLRRGGGGLWRAAASDAESEFKKGCRSIEDSLASLNAGHSLKRSNHLLKCRELCVGRVHLLGQGRLAICQFRMVAKYIELPCLWPSLVVKGWRKGVVATSRSNKVENSGSPHPLVDDTGNWSEAFPKRMRVPGRASSRRDARRSRPDRRVDACGAQGA